MDKRVQGFETQLYVCSVVRNKPRVERARNFFGITHLGDLTAVWDVGLGAKKGGELGGGNEAGVMTSHNAPNKYVQRTGWRIKQAIDSVKRNGAPYEESLRTGLANREASPGRSGL